MVLFLLTIPLLDGIYLLKTNTPPLAYEQVSAASRSGVTAISYVAWSVGTCLLAVILYFFFSNRIFFFKGNDN